ncbi:MAG: S8 family serine peptidase [Nanoarchaeota archaeon]|nr:S8 family serine peptidase [Nanoarchaeota archaeon]
MVKKKEMEREILPHITLKTYDDTKLKKTGMAIGGYSHRPIGASDFRNMLSKAVSVGNVKSDGFDNSYFLMELGAEYYSSGVSSMLKDLDIKIKTVLTETQIIVKAIPKKIEEYFRKKQTIPKKITEPIKSIYALEGEDKIGDNLLRLIKEDIDKRKTFGISIQLLDNLDQDEEENFKEIMKQELSREINPAYLENSKQFICGTSAKRIIEISKKPFIKRIAEQGKAKPQEYFENELILTKDSIEYEKNEDVPIICVIDSGISGLMEEFCVNRDQYIFKTPDDTVNHGSSVSSICVFGEDLVFKRFPLKQKSKIISLKLDDIEKRNIPIEEALMTAIRKYKHITKIFCLSYAYEDTTDLGLRLDAVKKLDYFIQENNVSVIVASGNIDLFDAYNDRENYPKYLSKYPVLSPAEAKNIIAVGSLCKKSTNSKIIVSKNTRLGIHPVFLRDDLDKYRFFKPDLLTYGGNSELKLNQDRIAVSTDLEIATINNQGDLVHNLGTSYSAPLIALCLSRLYKMYNYVNSETYKAILLNQACYDEINGLPVFNVLDTENVINCNDGIYLNFEGEVNPKYRSEEQARTNIFECKTVKFNMPEEAESIDIITVHSNNHKFQDLRRFNTRLVVEIVKGNGKTIAKKYGTMSRNCANTYGHYTFSRDFAGEWSIKVHVETRGISSDELDSLKVRFGISIRINLKEEHKNDLKKIYYKIKGVEEELSQELSEDAVKVIIESSQEGEKGIV